MEYFEFVFKLLGLIAFYCLPITGIAIISYIGLFLYLRKFKQIIICNVLIIDLKMLLNEKAMLCWAAFCIPILNALLLISCILSASLYLGLVFLEYCITNLRKFLLKISGEN
jgi:hypothetical protein